MTDSMKRSYDVPLEAEAEALVEVFNEAKPDYSPELEWFAMRHDPETGTEYFYLEAENYADSDGLQALRDCGREIHYIEANGLGDEQIVGIEIAVQETIPSPTEGSK